MTADIGHWGLEIKNWKIRKFENYEIRNPPDRCGGAVGRL